MRAGGRVCALSAELPSAQVRTAILPWAELADGVLRECDGFVLTKEGGAIYLNHHLAHRHHADLADAAPIEPESWVQVISNFRVASEDTWTFGELTINAGWFRRVDEEVFRLRPPARVTDLRTVRNSRKRWPREKA